MTCIITDGNTVLDFLELILQHNELLPQKQRVTIVALNKAEWVQLLNLHRLKHPMSMNLLFIDENGTTAKYKDLSVYYDGFENGNIDFHYVMENMNERMRQLHGNQDEPNAGLEP